MREVWSTARVREAERAVLDRTPPGALMRRAAFAVSVRAARLLVEHAGRIAGARVVLLVGSGDNGGDALWAGAMLRRRGVRVSAVLLNPARAHPEGLAALVRARGTIIREPERAKPALEGADLVIDGIVGLSARGGLRPAAADLVRAVSSPVLAVDLPSGVDPDTGVVLGDVVRATATVTFGAYKPLHVLAPAAGMCGDVSLVDLGLRPELGEPDLRVLDAADVGAVWPVPRPADDKYTQGVTGVAAGSSRYPGAAVLTAGGAVQATSGMVRYAGHAADVVRSRWPEVIATGALADAGRVQSWVVGPGSGTGTDAQQVLREVLSAGVPVCADADATTMLAEHPELLDARDPATPLVLTPHDREFARLVGPVGDDRVAAARRAAEKYRAVVLLKGHSTVVAAADGPAYVNYTGRAWPATPGSGDVLSGIIGALLAAGFQPVRAAAFAAFLHDEAAARAAGAARAAAACGAGDPGAPGAPAPASAIVSAIPDAIRGVRAVVQR